jgi:hypothetical protein
VGGEKIFVDSSLIDADASNNSVVDTQSVKGGVKVRQVAEENCDT